MRKYLRTWALLAGVMAASTSVAACSSSEDEGDVDEGELGSIDRESLFTGKWTNWYNRELGGTGILGRVVNAADKANYAAGRASLTGLLKVSAMRDWLVESNLFDTNPNAKVEKIGQADVRCEEFTKTNRTIDGTCNDQANVAMGAANVRFGRNVPLEHTYAKDILSPSPREISRKLLTRPVGADGQPVVQEVPFLNLLALAWIQYMNHDWFSHGAVEKTADVASNQIIEIPLAADDPFRRDGLTVLSVRKTETLAPAVPGRAPSYYNENTHWWDGSQLYGSSKAVSDALRVKGSDGKLKAELDLPGGYLPEKDGLEQSGFIRNWWVGMSILHTMFAREHNQIVGMLRSTHPEFSEEALFDKARMINAAGMAKIHTIEWTPAILPNPTLNLGMHANWYGLKTAIWANSKDSLLGNSLEGRPTDEDAVSMTDKLMSFLKVDSHAVNGLVGAKRFLGPNNVPFTLTEEFTSVYRLHSLLPENLVLSTSQGRSVIKTNETRKEAAGKLAKQHSMEAWLASFGAQKPGQLVLNNFPAFLQDIDVPGFKKYDIGAVDILRDRERGVPRYNKFRELLQLKPLASIDELTSDEKHRAAIKEIYGNDINKVDLLVGTLAETQRPDMFGFGETQFQIFILMASRRLMADRFFSDDFNAGSYTKEGIEWIQKVNFKNVIARNYPDLGSRLANIENAFMPWDGSAGKAVPTKFPQR